MENNKNLTATYVVTGVGTNTFIDFLRTWALSNHMMPQILSNFNNAQFDNLEDYYYIRIAEVIDEKPNIRIEVRIKKPPEYDHQSIEVIFLSGEGKIKKTTEELHSMFDKDLINAYICYPSSLLIKQNWNLTDWDIFLTRFYAHKKKHPYKDLRWLPAATGKTYQAVRDAHSRFQRIKKQNVV